MPAGTVIVHIPAGAATAIHNGNLTEESTSTDNVVTYAPFTVTINQAAGQDDPTSTSPILFDVEFSEPVTGFTDADVAITGTAGATEGTVSGSGDTYTVSVAVDSQMEIVGVLYDTLFTMGAPRGIFVEGDYVYWAATSQSKMTVIDVSDPTSPVIAGQATGSSPGGGWAVVKQGNYAYTTGAIPGSLSVVDVSTPASPTVVGTVANGTRLNNAQSLCVDGNYAYVCANGNSRLTVVDISNPAAPSVVGSIQNATYFAGAGGPCKSGNYVFVVSGSRLTVVDVSNPAAPTVSTSLVDATNLNSANDAVLLDGVIYVNAAGDSRLTAVDISIPTSPTVLSSLQDTTLLFDAQAVATDGVDVVYVVSQDGHLTAVDVSNPLAMEVVTSVDDIDIYQQAWDVGTNGTHVFVASGGDTCLSSTEATLLLMPITSGTVIANIPAAVAISAITGTANPASTSTDNVVTYEAPATCPITGLVTDASMTDVEYIATSGDFAYVGSFFGNTITVIDISDPTTPTVVTSVNDSDLFGVNHLRVHGTTLFASCEGSDALVALDISTPASMSIVGTFTHADLNGCEDVVIVGSTAFVASFVPGRVVAIDVSTPSAMTFISSVADARLVQAYSIAHNGVNHVIVGSAGSGTNRLVTVNVSNPAAMTVADDLVSLTINDVYTIHATSTLAIFVCYQSRSVAFADISDPTNISLISANNDPDSSFPIDLVVSGTIAYVSVAVGGAGGGVIAIDFSNPAVPVVVGSAFDAVMDSAYGIARNGDYLIVSVQPSISSANLVHVSCVT